MPTRGGRPIETCNAEDRTANPAAGLLTGVGEKRGYDTRPLSESELEAFLPEAKVPIRGYGDTPDGKVALTIIERAKQSRLDQGAQIKLMERLQADVDVEVATVKAEWARDGRMAIDDGEAYLRGCERWLAKQIVNPEQFIEEDERYDHLGHCDAVVELTEDASPRKVTTDGFRGEYAFLSNFHESPVHFQDQTYRCSESALQAAKFADKGFRDRFANLDGRAAKQLGKTRHPSFRTDWETAKFQVMGDVLRAKFANPGLREALRATRGTELIEFNRWRDETWGVSINSGNGENRLGKLLMEIRDSIPDEGGE